MNSTSARDDALCQQAKNGSNEAFESLVRIHQRTVRSFVSRQIGDGTIADDISQEVFIRAFRGIQSFRGIASFSAWLIGIARNLVLLHLRERSRQTDTSELTVALANARLNQLDHDLGEAEFEELQLDALRGCIDQLSGEHEEIIQQFYFNGQTAEWIAKRKGRPAGTVRMTLLRIRQALKDCVDGKLGSPRDD